MFVMTTYKSNNCFQNTHTATIIQAKSSTSISCQIVMSFSSSCPVLGIGVGACQREFHHLSYHLVQLFRGTPRRTDVSTHSYNQCNSGAAVEACLDSLRLPAAVLVSYRRQRQWQWHSLSLPFARSTDVVVQLGLVAAAAVSVSVSVANAAANGRAKG